MERKKDIPSLEESENIFLAIISTIKKNNKQQPQHKRTKQGHANANGKICFFAIQPNK